jgi:aldose 1-epimerase
MHELRGVGFMVLSNAGSHVTLDAAHGGAIREFSWRDQPILRPAATDADADPFSMACFPLVPYANRIAQGSFRFDGREIQLRRNWDRDPHPLHGQGWRSAWTIDRASSSTAVMAFDGGGDDWPWRYRATQELTVLPDGLEIRLSVTNQSNQDMPAMLGQHPYFANSAAATLKARARTVWLADAQALPVREVLTPSDWSFDEPRGIARVALDHCFDHWDGLAIVRWPDRVLTLTTTGAQSLHIYAPAGADFFCLEPQTAAVGALNRESGGAARLRPGATLELSVRFSVAAATA